MNNVRTLIATSLFAAAALASPLALAKLAKSGGAQVSFNATGPAGLKIVGTTNDLDVSEKDSAVVVTVPLKNLDTKIELRNKHMREKYLEVDKYPNAELTVARSALKVNGADASGEAAGTMKIHGREKQVVFKYSAKKTGPGYAVNGSTTLNIKDFGIEEPSFMGASVKPNVDVNVSFNVSE